jgi:microcystin degradation protein MlrC
MPRVAVARLWFCSNSFTPRRTRIEDLRAHEWTAGTEALARRVGAGDELDGVHRFIGSRPGWDVTFLRCASAPAGGPLSAELFGIWMADIEDHLRRGRFDGVYLSLHGACQAEGDPAADVTILRRVRALVGHTPVVASFDLRANLSEETAILLDGASANRAWPAGGGDMAAIRALTLLEGILSGRSRPVGALARVPMVLADPFQHEALGDLWRDEMPRLDAALPGGPVLDASVFGGFAWGDSPYTGPSALVWADRDAGAARETAARLALLLARWRTRLVPKLATAEVMIDTLDLGDQPDAARSERSAPVVLLDPSDDPVVGGLADTPGILRAVIAAAEQGRLTGPVAIAALHDPDTVTAACAGGPGQGLQRPLGGRVTPVFGAPVLVRATVRSVVDTDRFGLCAVLRIGQVDIVVTSRRPADIGPDLFAVMGLTPSLYRLLAVKGGQTARVAFGAIAREIVACECPGPAATDLLRLPYHYVPASRRVSAIVDPADNSGFATRAVPRGSAGERGDGERLAGQPSDKFGAHQPDGRHEERRANPQKKRPESFGAQRR